jgi:hypothetical protein
MDFRFHRLERRRVGGTGHEMTLSVPAPKSPSGKSYQQCPSHACVPRLFQIGEAPEGRAVAEVDLHRSRRQPGPGETVCPYCGHQAGDEAFVSFDDVEAVKRLIFWEAEQDVGDWVHDLARDFNRRQPRGGLIRMRMEARTPRSSRPLAIREDLLRDLACHICARPYGVYAIALFCPDCGAPNLLLHFRREVELVARQTQLADQAKGGGEPELAYRLLGNAHEDVLTAFETALKTVYRCLVRQRLPEKAEELCSKRAIGNRFQNVDRARVLYADLTIDPFGDLDETDLSLLRRNIEKRHVIGHNLSLADETYTDLTEDAEPGRTVQLLGADILRFAATCEHVVGDLEIHLYPSKPCA